jgi:DNA-directed RNA polymerase specialized sigma24 family protein
MTDFQTTRWTLVLTAHAADPVARRTALEELCQGYWQPVYAYIVRRGADPEDARDLTQAFFERLLEKNWLETTDQGRGKFRAFLLTLLKRFLADAHDYATRMKRGGHSVHLPLEGMVTNTALAAEASPEEAYDRQWALTTVLRATQVLEAEALAAGKAASFAVLGPFVADEPPPGAYEAAAVQLSISRAAVGMAVHRLRARLRELIWAEVAATLMEGANVENEMAVLLAALRPPRP